MCDSIKDMKLLRRQYELAVSNDIEIIEIEFSSGKLKYRDRWSVKEIFDRDEESKKWLEEAVRNRKAVV